MIFAQMISSDGLQCFDAVCYLLIVTCLIEAEDTHTHTNVQRFFVEDYPGRPVPEETLTHSHPSCSSDILYQLHPSTTIHSVDYQA